MTIFGRSWEEIQAMQQGKTVGRAVPPGDTRPRATDDDIQKLRDWGLEGLQARRFDGVIDRLVTSGYLPDSAKWYKTEDDI